jgi:hypothetical protein
VDITYQAFIIFSFHKAIHGCGNLTLLLQIHINKANPTGQTGGKNGCANMDTSNK